MKRRLDLALALVHRPRVLPRRATTGLDPQSRTALWEEVARLVEKEGMTVFLTTQYLEEADVLADRVGIIDHGDLVAEGTPERLKAEIGRPTVEVVPLDGNEFAAISDVLARFGELEPAARKGVGVRLRPGIDDMAEVIRRSMQACGSRTSSFTLRPPRRRLPRQDQALPGGRGRGREEAPDALRQSASPRSACPDSRRPVRPSARVQLGKLARRSIARTLRQPIMVVPNFVFPLFMLAVISGGAGEQATRVEGFPTDNYTTSPRRRR